MRSIPKVQKQTSLTFYRLLRESSKAQKDRYGLPTQRRVTERYAVSLGGIVTEENTAIVLESAVAWVRDEWQTAVSEGLCRFHSGLINAFLLPRVDRETRNLFASIPILREVIDQGIPIYFAEEDICLTPSAADALQTYLEAAMEAAAYLRRLVKNTKPARIARARDDQKHPTNTEMFGSDFIDGKRVPNQAEAAALREAAQITLREGRPMSGATWLNDQGFRTTHGKKFKAGSIRDLFRNRALIGETVINFEEEQVIIRHEGILDRATFEALQTLLDERRLRAMRSEKSFYALSGIPFCWCGARFEPNKIKHNHYYRCERRCGERSWRQEELEVEVWKAFWHYLEQRQSRKEYLRRAQQSSARLQRDLSGIERSIAENDDGWRTLLAKDLADYPDIIINEEKRKLKAERDSLLREKIKLEPELLMLPQVDAGQVEQELNSLAESFQMANTGGYGIGGAMSWERVTIREKTLSDEQAHFLRDMLLKLNCKITIHNRAVFVAGKLPLPQRVSVASS